MSNLSGILYSQPSFLEGVSRILDFSNSLNEYNISASPEEADSDAFWSDTIVTGSDFRSILNNLREELQLR